MHPKQRETALDAVDVLNDLVGDFVAGTNVLRDYRDLFAAEKIPLEQMICIQKMCISYLVLGLCKFIEFRKHYGHIIPDLHRKNLKSIEKKINEKYVRDFRNKCVGHILDERTKRPIPHSEIINFLTNFGSIADLLNWINDKAPGSAANVVRAIENARDELCLIYNIKPEEVLNR